MRLKLIPVPIAVLHSNAGNPDGMCALDIEFSVANHDDIVFLRLHGLQHIINDLRLIVPADLSPVTADDLKIICNFKNAPESALPSPLFFEVATARRFPFFRSACNSSTTPGNTLFSNSPIVA